jgi:DNA polymerase-3 subunit epsilon
VSRCCTSKPVSTDSSRRDSCTKSCELLIAADPASESGKVDNARKHGIPVAAFADYRKALRTATPLTVTRLASGGVGQVCEKCGDSWLAAHKATHPICPGCRSSAR